MKHEQIELHMNVARNERNVGTYLSITYTVGAVELLQWTKLNYSIFHVFLVLFPIKNNLQIGN